MLQDKIAKLLNEQVQKELYSAYLYLDFANYYSAEGLTGFENWFTIQAKEEMDHAILMRAYLLNNGAPIKLLPIQAPDKVFADHGAPLEASLEHERYVTASIYIIYEAAMAEKDYRTVEFLNWFVKEQGEEEKNAADLIRKHELFGGEAKALYTLDQELAGRVYSPPSLILD